MFIVWGFRAISKTLSEGTFFCPRDGGDRQYRLRSARRWFTIFWIPLIPLKELGTFVECSSCQSTYYETVLSAPTTSQMADVSTIAMRHLAVAMVLADGEVDEAEKSAAVDVVNASAVGEYNIDHFERDLAGLSPSSLTDKLEELGSMLSQEGKERVVAVAVQLAAADGVIDESELDVARQVGEAISMSTAHVRGTIDSAVERLSI